MRSTRGNEKICASQAIIKGLASDGGLFIFDEIPSFAVNKETLKLDYNSLAEKILGLFLDDFSKEEIHEIVEISYSKKNFNDKILNIEVVNDISFLELYYGNTLAFKDMALSILPNLLSVSKAKNGINDKTYILTATSGDTGSAALNGFKNVSGVDVTVFYPSCGVSRIQEAQMLSFEGENTHAYAVCGNFDDCQSLVKKIFQSYQGEKSLSSANSINIGRLLPQIVYYFYAYIDLVNKDVIKLGDEINVSVPTGNFGNVLAGYIAKKMGLKINDFIIASNKNDVLTDFFKTGIYDKNRGFYKTNTPSMDILVSSNLERLLFLVTKDANLVKGLMDDLNNIGRFDFTKHMNSFPDIKAYRTLEDKTIEQIRECYYNNKYLMDPHTAVAYDGYLQYKKETKNKNHTLIVSTASYYKFPKTILEALGVKELADEFEMIDEIENLTMKKIPQVINDLRNTSKKPHVVSLEEAWNLI